MPILARLWSDDEYADALLDTHRYVPWYLSAGNRQTGRTWLDIRGDTITSRPISEVTST